MMVCTGCFGCSLPSGVEQLLPDANSYLSKRPRGASLHLRCEEHQKALTKSGMKRGRGPEVDSAQGLRMALGRFLAQTSGAASTNDGKRTIAQMYGLDNSFFGKKIKLVKDGRTLSDYNIQKV